ncbi:hypothetical protein VC60_gp67 [Mycobacterium phage Sbash]|uniref:Uncharacterized protein n=1 Tax=Mycobacterium phage Sbash TaxID=1567475 RepID=A0A0A7RVW3_9CAUD|nr:hypothetical protein VC60_gp67 [Mycobacterium phage Sbash]AJA43368.1 hypothetical protein PBI_SBASH_67 [Mycobacterium phage Sbash]
MSDRIEPKEPSRDEIDAELELAIMGYDRRDTYPEWSNASMREAYRAGWADGRDAAAREMAKPIRELHQHLSAAALFEDAEVEHGMRLVLDAIAPLVYTGEELSAGSANNDLGAAVRKARNIAYHELGIESELPGLRALPAAKPNTPTPED